MVRRVFDIGLRVGVVAALAAGLVLIAIQDPLFTTFGVLSVILGLMGLMPVVRNGLVEGVA